MENFIQNYLKYFVIIALCGVVSKFMSKERNEEKTINSDIITFEIKKMQK